MANPSEPDPATTGEQTARQGGCHELRFSGNHTSSAKVPELPLQVSFLLPSGARIPARAFATADGQTKARCYLPESGNWRWEAKNSAGKGVASGAFTVEESSLPGKLRISRVDQRHFAYANGQPFLHLGDTAWKLLDPSVANWEAYIDQAAQVGFTKLRVRLPHAEDSCENFYDPHRQGLNLAFWDEAERRLLYALARYPRIQFQLDLFAKDRAELDRYEEGDALTHLAVAYAIERFSPLPNVHWLLASDIDPARDSAVTLQALSRLGKTLFEQSPWHSLVACSQPRFAPFLFDREKWCGMSSLASIGEVTGAIAQENRALTRKPIVVDLDRSEHENAPLIPRYYFRRLFWGLLLSGAHPTYHGLDTSGKTQGHHSGIVPYYDACHAGRLKNGAHDFLHIHAFFRQIDTSLEGWAPDDSIAGNKPLLAKAMRSPGSDQCIVYISNPDSHAGHTGAKGQGFYSDQNAAASDIFTTFNLELPFASGSARWFSPTTGQWKGQVEILKSSTIFLTPEPGDWVLWIQRDKP